VQIDPLLVSLDLSLSVSFSISVCFFGFGNVRVLMPEFLMLGTTFKIFNRPLPQLYRLTLQVATVVVCLTGVLAGILWAEERLYWVAGIFNMELSVLMITVVSGLIGVSFEFVSLSHTSFSLSPQTHDHDQGLIGLNYSTQKLIRVYSDISNIPSVSNSLAPSKSHTQLNGALERNKSNERDKRRERKDREERIAPLRSAIRRLIVFRNVMSFILVIALLWVTVVAILFFQESESVQPADPENFELSEQLTPVIVFSECWGRQLCLIPCSDLHSRSLSFIAILPVRLPCAVLLFVCVCAIA
jgi:hypothetical protein